MISNFHTGEIWQIHTYRGEQHSVEYGEIVKIRDIESNPPQDEAFARNIVTRSQFLITFKNLRTAEHRSYYHAFIFGKRLSMTERLWLTTKKLFGYEDV